jgi:hypothetical protein
MQVAEPDPSQNKTHVERLFWPAQLNKSLLFWILLLISARPISACHQHVANKQTKTKKQRKMRARES